MTKIQKKSTQDLIDISRGLTTLTKLFVYDLDSNYSEESKYSVFKVLDFQLEIQNEIELRLPFSILEAMDETEAVIK